MGFSATETIGRPKAEVWGAATDWARAPQWMKGIEELRPLQEGPVGEGTRLGFRARGSERETTIVGWDPGRRLALRSRQGGVTADYVYRFEDCPGGTRVTLDAECRGEGLGWRLVTPLIGLLMAHADGGQPRALKKMIEGPEATGSSPAA